MIFIDSNIPMYVIGAEHRNKGRAIDLVETSIGREQRLVTSAEVFQEIVHRYTRIRRTDAIQHAFDFLHGIVDEIFSIGIDEVEVARETVLAYKGLSSRDALHVAVMKRHEVSAIMTFDSGFDVIPGLQLLPGSHPQA